VPVADNLIHFEFSGPGKILGVGNATRPARAGCLLPVWPGIRWLRTMAGAGKKPPSRGTPACRNSPRRSTIPPGRRLMSIPTNQLGDNEHGFSARPQGDGNGTGRERSNVLGPSTATGRLCKRSKAGETQKRCVSAVDVTPAASATTLPCWLKIIPFGATSLITLAV